MFVRVCWDVPPKYGSASLAWANAKFRHTTGTPPAGAPIFWTGGGQGFGHVALSTGNGSCWSTDILRDGWPDHVTIDLIDRAWGNLTRVGWSEDINDVRVITVDQGQGGGEPIEPPPPEIPEPPETEDDMQLKPIRVSRAADGDPTDLFVQVYAFTSRGLQHVTGETSLNGLRATEIIAAIPGRICTAPQFDAAVAQVKEWGMSVDCPCSEADCRLENQV
jgi:hypothetical protein